VWIRSAFKTVTSISRPQWLVGVLVAAAVGGITFTVTQPQAPSQTPVQSTGPDPLISSEIQTILPMDAIRAVDHPQFVASDKAGMRWNLNIIGVALGGEAHAFPIAFMSRVEIVNDRLGGTNIAVTW
jgi:uncharacterized protein DUF3179